MRVALYRDEAVVLRVQKLGEADRIITLLTRRNGRVRAVAKGVRRTRSRFGATVEPFSHVDVQLYPGRSLDVVTQAESLHAYGQDLVARLPPLHRGTAVLETAERLTAEEREPSLKLYLLVVGALRALTEGRDPGLVLDAFLLRAMSVSGYEPSLVGCGRCGDPGPTARSASPAAGRCAARAASRELPRVGGASLELMVALLEGDWETADAAEPRARREASGLVAAYLQWHLERGLRSLPLVERCSRRRRAAPVRDGSPPPRTRPAPGRPQLRGTGAAPRRDRHGRQRPLGQGPRTAADGWPRGGGGSLFDVVEGAIEVGVKWVSAYAFCTENWKRSPDEVRFLMGFNRDVIRRRRDEMHALGVRVRWAGRRPRLWRIGRSTSSRRPSGSPGENTVCTLTMCVNYGGRAEIADAARALALDVAAGRVKPERVDERVLARYLDEPDMPDVDLFLRTSGEQRTSNFLLWQSAYAEMVFVPELWPDVDRRVLWRACEQYSAGTAATAGPSPTRPREAAPRQRGRGSGRTAAVLPFYELLGLTQVQKPAEGVAKTGAWFDLPGGTTQVHVSERAGARHPDQHFALAVEDLDATARALQEAGHPWQPRAEVLGARRGMTADPEGNAIELVEAVGPFA